MKAAKDRTFLGAGFAVLLVMQVEDLPVPLSLSWREGYGVRPLMWVQVQDDHFRQWLDQLDAPELSSDQHGGDWHIHAEGALTCAPTTLVHIVTVTREPLTATEV